MMALVCTLKVLHVKHLRRLAQARLDIARAVLEMDRLMGAGKVTLGHKTHDILYQMMLRSQYTRKWLVPWRFWEVSKAERECYQQINREVANNPALKEIHRQFRTAAFSALWNNRPIMGLIFVLWVFIFLGGLSLLISGILARAMLRKSIANFKQLVIDSYGSWMAWQTSTLNLKGC